MSSPSRRRPLTYTSGWGLPLRYRLVVQFSLREPEVWVGYRHWIDARDVDVWRSHGPELIAELSQLAEYAVHASYYPDLNIPLHQASAQDVDQSWLRELLDMAGTNLAIHRTLRLDSLTSTAGVVEMILEDRKLVERLPFLLTDVLGNSAASEN